MKLTFTLVGTGIFWRLRHLPQSEVAAWAVLLTYLALLMRWSTYTSAVIAML